MTSRAARSRSEFPVSDQAKVWFTGIMTEAFTRELAKLQRYTLTDQAGPDVMMVRGALLDVVSFVPPERTGRGNIYLSSVGAVTLVIELRDAESNAVIARIVDRRAAQPPGSVAQPSNTVTNRADVRRLANRWANRLREKLDDLPAQTPADD